MIPRDMSWSYSTLNYVSSLAEKTTHVTFIVTFDQPLYWKAKTIVAGEPDGSGMQSIVVRLEGFHTEMSLLGYIGKLMDNSGL